MGVPPEEFGESDLGIIVVPDRLKNVCYAIDPQQIRCLALDLSQTKLGEQSVQFPKSFERMEKNVRKPNKAQRDDYGFNDRYHIAATLGNKLHLYLFSAKNKSIYFTALPAFDISNAPKLPIAESQTVESDTSAAGGENTQFPLQSPIGRKITFRLPGAAGASYELMTGSPSAKIERGTLIWTPTKGDVGEQQFKIRMKSGSEVSFLRLQTTVVGPVEAIAKGPVSRKGNVPSQLPSADFGGENTVVHLLEDKNIGLSYSLDRGFVIIADGNKARFLDPTGTIVEREHTFASRYKQILERPEYYVALAAKSVDLIDKKSFKILKSIEVDYSQLHNIAIHPTKKLSYVAFAKPSEKDYIKSKPVVLVNEDSGQLTELANVYGLWLHITPKGDRLITGLQQIYEDTTALSFRTEFAHIDRVFAYDITGAHPRLMGVNEQPGANGRRLRMSVDGKHVAYVAGGGAGGNGYSIAALATDDVTRESSRYQIDAYPTDIAFHPKLNMVACCNESKVWIFDRRTGEELKNRLDPQYKFQKIEQLFFAADGTRLLVAHQAKQGRVLQAIPLKNSNDE